MAFQISPGVNISEVDLTTVVPSVSTTAGAFAGPFIWGPVNKIKLIDSELTLSKTFGRPDANCAASFFTAANFLAYGNNLQVVRSIAVTSKNAAGVGFGNLLVNNEDDFEQNYLYTDNAEAYGSFIARYPGTLGNSIKVSVCDNVANFASWTYRNYFTSGPSTSAQAIAAGGYNDEMHIVIIDEDGLFTGTKGAILETFAFVSKASDAVINGDTNYYKQVIFNQSKYVYAIDPIDYTNTNASWGRPSNTNFFQLDTVKTVSLQTGSYGMPVDGELQGAYDLFNNKESIDISLIITGAASVPVQQYIINNIAANRADCVAFISPPSANVVNQSGNETTNITAWLTALNVAAGPGSYTVADSGWKYQYDKYANIYRWVPLNGDIAGLCVYTDSVRDPWFSPAGFNRGAIKNCIKLAWNPSKTYRDVLYAAGVNPVVSFPGQGTVLFGDKTLQNKPSAFDRINVRRLFITLEKAISTAAKFSLFELNDEFTRAQFVALVTPFLRDIQGRRGITDFKVVCDTTNNTPQVIDGNQFVGDIYIKPARSTNYIQLNFVAVGTGVDFATIVGAV